MSSNWTKAYPDLARRYNREYRQSAKWRYSYAKNQARQRRKSFTLSFEEYESLIQLPCHYCKKITFGAETAIGLDRIDNNKGYEITNVLPCCGEDNKHRQSSWTVEEMEVAAKAIFLLRNK